jgi:hypothetical protein
MKERFTSLDIQASVAELQRLAAGLLFWAFFSLSLLCAVVLLLETEPSDALLVLEERDCVLNHFIAP